MNRRRFLRALACVAAVAACPGVAAARKAGGAATGKAREPAPAAGASPAEVAAGGRLVVVFLRGGVDQASVLPPFGDDFYRLARPTTALSPPGSPGGALPLPDGAGLHPALAPLLADFEAGRLAFVQGVGLPEAVRDHALAQRILEAGVGTAKALPEAGGGGWMNRLSLELGGASSGSRPDRTPRAVFATPRRPLILTGKARSVNLPPGRYAYPADAATLPDVTALDAALAGPYAAKGVPTVLTGAFREGVAQRRARLAALAREMSASQGGDPPVSRFPDLAARLAGELTRDPRLSLAFLAFGGLDTHVRQGAATGRLAEALEHAAKGLRALADGLASELSRTVIVVVSEFGRSLSENATGGTDNGHGGLMWLLGGPVAGGRLYGQSPSLAGRRLYREHLPPATMDYRQPLSVILREHLGLSAEAASRVFPGYSPAETPEGFLRAASGPGTGGPTS